MAGQHAAWRHAAAHTDRIRRATSAGEVFLLRCASSARLMARLNVSLVCAGIVELHVRPWLSEREEARVEANEVHVLVIDLRLRKCRGDGKTGQEGSRRCWRAFGPLLCDAPRG